MKSEWLEGKEPTEQPRFHRNVHCKYASVFYGEEVYNDWKIAEKLTSLETKKLDVDALKLEVL